MADDQIDVEAAKASLKPKFEAFANGLTEEEGAVFTAMVGAGDDDVAGFAQLNRPWTQQIQSLLAWYDSQGIEY